MKKALYTLALITFLIASGNLEAQLLDRLTKKIEQKAAERLERKVDKTIDKTLDKTEEEIDKSVSKKPKSEGEEQKVMHPADDYEADKNTSKGVLAGLMKKVNIKDEYSFDLSLSYTTTVISEKETYVGEYDFVMSDKGDGDILMVLKDFSKGNKSDKQIQNMTMIFDVENKAMISISREEKVYMPISMDIGGMAEEENEQNDIKITKTGNSKTILGYTCQEYEIDSNDSYGTLWASNDSRLKDFDPFLALEKTAQKNKRTALPTADVEGAVMEMNMTMKKVEKKSDPKTVNYIVTEVKDVNIKEDFEGYTNPMQGY